MSSSSKIFFLSTLAIVASILSWFSLKISLEGASRTEGGIFSLVSLVRVLVPVFSFALFLGLFSFLSLLSPLRFLPIGTAFLSSLSVVGFFPFSLPLLLTPVILTAALGIFSYHLRKESQTRKKFLIGKILDSGMGPVIVGILLVVSVTYHSSIASKPNAGRNTINRFLNNIVTSTGKILPQFIPGFRLEMPLDEFFFMMSRNAFEKQLKQEGISEEKFSSELRDLLKTGKISRNQIPKDLEDKIEKGTLGPEDFFNLPPVQEKFRAEIQKNREDFLKRVGVRAEGTEEMSTVLERILGRYANQYVGPYESFIPTFLAAGLFFTLAAFGWFYKLIMKFIGWIMLKIFVRFRWVRIKEQEEKVEVMTL